MAVSKEKVKRELVLEFDEGIVAGKQETSQKRYSNINLAATDDKILSAGQILSGLADKTVINIMLRDTDALKEA